MASGKTTTTAKSMDESDCEEQDSAATFGSLVQVEHPNLLHGHPGRQGITAQGTRLLRLQAVKRTGSGIPRSLVPWL